MANFSDPYSTLKPETSSDSPSAKSKGVRFNSATTVIIQGTNVTSKGKTNHLTRPLLAIPPIAIVSHVITIHNRIKAKEIS